MTWWRWLLTPLWVPAFLLGIALSGFALAFGCPDEVYAKASRGLLEG